jgi:hypothetical protein
VVEDDEASAVAAVEAVAHLAGRLGGRHDVEGDRTHRDA